MLDGLLKPAIETIVLGERMIDQVTRRFEPPLQLADLFMLYTQLQNRPQIALA